MVTNASQKEGNNPAEGFVGTEWSFLQQEQQLSCQTSFLSRRVFVYGKNCSPPCMFMYRQTFPQNTDTLVIVFDLLSLSAFIISPLHSSSFSSSCFTPPVTQRTRSDTLFTPFSASCCLSSTMSHQKLIPIDQWPSRSVGYIFKVQQLRTERTIYICGTVFNLCKPLYSIKQT